MGAERHLRLASRRLSKRIRREWRTVYAKPLRERLAIALSIVTKGRM